MLRPRSAVAEHTADPNLSGGPTNSEATVDPTALFVPLVVALMVPGLQLLWGEDLGSYRNAVRRLEAARQQARELRRLGLPIEARRVVRKAKCQLIWRAAFEEYTRSNLSWFYYPLLVGLGLIVVLVFWETFLVLFVPPRTHAIAGICLMAVSVVLFLVQGLLVWLARRWASATLQRWRSDNPSAGDDAGLVDAALAAVGPSLSRGTKVAR